MKYFGERIKQARKSAKLTQKELADRIGVTNTAVSNWEQNRNRPDPDQIEMLCGILHVTPNFFLLNEEKSDELALSDSSLFSTPFLLTSEEENVIKKYRGLDDHGKKIVDFVLSEEAERMEAAASAAKTSVYDMVEYYTPVSAGRGVMLDGTGEFFHYNVVANRYTEKADFTLRVQGHSMEPRFHDGDRLLVEEAPDVDFGEVGIFVVDGQGYVKVKGDMRLLSINPKYPGVEIDEYTYYRCVGRVIGTLDPSWVVK